MPRCSRAINLADHDGPPMSDVALPAGVTWRPLRREDVGAMSELQQRLGFVPEQRWTAFRKALAG